MLSSALPKTEQQDLPAEGKPIDGRLHRFDGTGAVDDNIETTMAKRVKGLLVRIIQRAERQVGAQLLGDRELLVAEIRDDDLRKTGSGCHCRNIRADAADALESDALRWRSAKLFIAVDDS